MTGAGGAGEAAITDMTPEAKTGAMGAMRNHEGVIVLNEGQQLHHRGYVVEQSLNTNSST